MTEKHGYGGAREGSGRKVEHTGDRVYISGFFAEAKLAHKLKALLRKTGQSNTEFFNDAIKKATKD